MNWVEMLGLSASGGIFGVLGAAFGGWMKFKERKQKAKEDVDLREHQVRMINLQTELKMQQSAWNSMTQSQQSETALNSQENYKWVIAVKSLFRPFLTVILWVFVLIQLSIILTGSLQEYLKLANDSSILSTEELITIIRYVIYSTVFSATTATTWWFGERALSSPEIKNR